MRRAERSRGDDDGLSLRRRHSEPSKTKILLELVEATLGSVILLSTISIRKKLSSWIRSHRRHVAEVQSETRRIDRQLSSGRSRSSLLAPTSAPQMALFCKFRLANPDCSPPIADFRWFPRSDRTPRYRLERAPRGLRSRPQPRGRGSVIGDFRGDHAARSRTRRLPKLATTSSSPPRAATYLCRVERR